IASSPGADRIAIGDFAVPATPIVTFSKYVPPCRYNVSPAFSPFTAAAIVFHGRAADPSPAASPFTGSTWYTAPLTPGRSDATGSGRIGACVLGAAAAGPAATTHDTITTVRRSMVP